MSYQPSRWAIGLVPLAVLWVLGSTGAQHDIEGRLSSRVGAAIRDDVNAAYVKARGRDVSLRGDAFTHASLKRAIEKANDAEGVRHVDSGRLGVITAVAPYVWRIERNDGRVKMSGDVPNPQAKAEIAAAAKSLGEVTDGATYGRGESQDLTAAAAYAAKVLANFTRGSAVYTDGALDVSGVASDAGGYARALALLNAPPKGVKLTRADVTPPLASPYVFSVAKGDGAATLAGGATSEQQKAALGKLAAKLFPGAKIDNRLAIESGEPTGEPAAAAWALDALAKLATGKAELRDSAITLTGKAGAPGDIEDLAALAAKAPAGFKIDTGAIVPPTVSDYAFAAARDAEGLHLTGYAPDAAARQALELAAKATGLAVDDRTQIAAGLPEGIDFGALVKFALDQLTGLEQGEVSLAGGKVSIKGSTPDWQAGLEAEKQAKAPPAGVTMGEVAIERPLSPDEQAAKLKATQEAKAEQARQAEVQRKAEAEAKAKAEERRNIEAAAEAEAQRKADAARIAEQSRAVAAAASAVEQVRRTVEQTAQSLTAAEARIAALTQKAQDAAEAARKAAADAVSGIQAAREGASGQSGRGGAQGRRHDQGDRRRARRRPVADRRRHSQGRSGRERRRRRGQGRAGSRPEGERRRRRASQTDPARFSLHRAVAKGRNRARGRNLAQGGRGRARENIR